MKPKIVKFEDGTYALRKFNIFILQYEYLDLYGGGLYTWRTKKMKFFSNCLASSEEELLERARNRLPGLRRVVQVKKF